jgi:hypothetical protein
MAAASFPIVSNPYQAFGNWYHRVSASLGRAIQPAMGPPTTRQPGQLSGLEGLPVTNSLGTNAFAPQWSVVHPALPRVLPWAGGIPHGVPGLGYTVAVAQGVSGTTARTTRPLRDANLRPRVPVASARVTVAPRPIFSWLVQGAQRNPATVGT